MLLKGQFSFPRRSFRASSRCFSTVRTESPSLSAISLFESSSSLLIFNILERCPGRSSTMVRSCAADSLRIISSYGTDTWTSSLISRTFSTSFAHLDLRTSNASFLAHTNSQFFSESSGSRLFRET